MIQATTGAPDELVILAKEVRHQPGQYVAQRYLRHGRDVLVTGHLPDGRTWRVDGIQLDTEDAAAAQVREMVDHLAGRGWTEVDLGSAPEPWDRPDPLAADAPTPF